MRRKMRGLAQIPLIIGLVIMAIAVPVATRLVEQRQDTRRSAARPDDAKFNGMVWDKSEKWKPGDDCDAREGVLSISSSRGQVAWQGDHFDVINNEKNKSVTVILTPPTACGYECDSWRIVERGEDPTLRKVYTGVGCEIEFVPTTEDYMSGVEFFIKYVSTPTPTPVLPNASNFSVNPSSVYLGDSVEVSFISSHVNSGDMIIYRKTGNESWVAWTGGVWDVVSENVTVDFAEVPSLLGIYEVGVAVYNAERTAVCSSDGNIYWVVDGVVGQDSGEDCGNSSASFTVSSPPVTGPTVTLTLGPTLTPTPTPILPDSSGEFALSRTTVSGGDEVRLDFYGIRAGDQILYYKLGGGSWVEGGRAPINSPSMPDSVYFDAPSVEGVYDVGVAIYNVARTAVCSSNGRIYWVNNGAVDSQTDTGETCNNSSVSLTVGVVSTPTPTGCPPEEVYDEARELAVNTYCTNALGVCDGSWVSPLECHVSEDGWGPFGSDCTAPYCTGCECVTSIPTPDGSVTSFNGLVVAKDGEGKYTKRWRDGNNCDAEKGVTVKVVNVNTGNENPAVTWMDWQGKHFDVHNSAVGAVQRVTLTPPTDCGLGCGTWQVVDISNGNNVIGSGSGCVAEFVQQGGKEWRDNVQFYLKSVSELTPTPESKEVRLLATVIDGNKAEVSVFGNLHRDGLGHKVRVWMSRGDRKVIPGWSSDDIYVHELGVVSYKLDGRSVGDGEFTSYVVEGESALPAGNYKVWVDSPGDSAKCSGYPFGTPQPPVGWVKCSAEGKDSADLSVADQPVKLCDEECLVDSDCKAGHFCSDVIAGLTGRLVCRSSECELSNIADTEGDCVCPTPTLTCKKFCRDGEELPGEAEGTFRGSCDEPTSIGGQTCTVVSNHGDDDVTDCSNCICSICRTDVTPMPTRMLTPTNVPGQPTNTIEPSGCPVLEGTLTEREAWRIEYLDMLNGTEKPTYGKTDFNCDGVVDLDDREEWRVKYEENMLDL